MALFKDILGTVLLEIRHILVREEEVLLRASNDLVLADVIVAQQEFVLRADLLEETLDGACFFGHVLFSWF